MNLVPAAEAAERVGKSRATIFGHMKAKRLKRYRRPGIDKRTFVDLDALLALLAVPPVTPPEAEEEASA